MAICLVTAIRIAVTHDEFSPTWDEPIHVEAGFEYLAAQRYTRDTEHPPLSRIIFAWPLRDAKVDPEREKRASDIYESAGTYMRGVVLSRRGNLIFVVAAIMGVYLWTAMLFGGVAGLIAAALFTNLPPILAHGGLATTDLAGTAMFALSMAATTFWLNRPNWWRTMVLGITIGVGLVCKFSFALFFAIGAVSMMFARRRFPLVKGIAAHLLAFVVVWGVYRFDHQRLTRIDPRYVDVTAELFGSSWLAREVNLPAPRFFVGLMDVAMHDREGHEAFLLGRLSEKGWWYYFPVALGVKTPLPFLALALAGGFLFIRRREQSVVVVIAFLMLVSLMRSHLNIGVRHALPMYVPLALLAAAAVVLLWRRIDRRVVVIALSAWLVSSTALTHPDYLPWMNAITGGRPERFLLDSNFDWGQDVFRLSVECRRLGITEIRTMLFGTTDYERIGLPKTLSVDPHVARPGWYAISETAIGMAQARDPAVYRWLTDNYRFRRIGRTIRLYRVL